MTQLGTVKWCDSKNKTTVSKKEGERARVRKGGGRGDRERERETVCNDSRAAQLVTNTERTVPHTAAQKERPCAMTQGRPN